jgi:hypothetical protein
MHADLIDRYGGSHGIRSQELLEAAYPQALAHTLRHGVRRKTGLFQKPRPIRQRSVITQARARYTSPVDPHRPRPHSHGPSSMGMTEIHRARDGVFTPANLIATVCRILCVLSTSAPLRARFSATSPATQTSSRPSIDMLCVLSISAPLRDPHTQNFCPPPNPIATVYRTSPRTLCLRASA